MNKALLAAVCSVFVPGSGHWIVRRWRRGTVLLGGLFAVLGVVAWFALRSTGDLLALLVQPNVLLLALAINAVLLLVRIFAVADSYRLGRAAAVLTKQQRGIGALLVVVLLLITAAPHAAVAYYNYTTYTLLTTLFVDDVAAASTSPAPSQDAVIQWTPAPSPTAASTATPPMVAAGRGTARPPDDMRDPTATPTLVPTPEPTPQPSADPWLATDRLNILLLGGDAGPERSGLRTDTMIVASIEPATGQAALFGVPRNLKNVPLPGPAARQFPCRCWPDLLNALYGYGQKNPHLFPDGPDPGAMAVQATISHMLGITIDGYALVDLGGFVDVIDAVGGVTLDIPEETIVRLSPPNPDEAWQTYRIPAGRPHLDGRTTLAYIRWRTDTNTDYDRMRRQRCVLSAVAREADVPGLLSAFPRLADVVKQRVNTNIPLAQLPDIMRLATKVDADQIKNVGFGPPRYNNGYAEGNYPVPDVPLIQRTVQTIFDTPADANDPEAPTVETTSESCGRSE